MKHLQDASLSESQPPTIQLTGIREAARDVIHANATKMRK